MNEKTTVPQRVPKSPALAGILSLIFPGTGALYNGQVSKAIFYMITFAGLITIQAYHGGQPFKALMLAAFYIFQFVESINSARAVNLAAETGSANAPVIPAAESQTPSGSIFWGITLIIIGLLFTLANFEIISYKGVFDLWPLAVIIIGLKMILEYFHKSSGEKNAE